MKVSDLVNTGTKSAQPTQSSLNGKEIMTINNITTHSSATTIIQKEGGFEATALPLQFRLNQVQSLLAPKNINQLPSIQMSMSMLPPLHTNHQQRHLRTKSIDSNVSSSNNNNNGATSPVSVHSAPSIHGHHEYALSSFDPVQPHSPQSTVSSLGHLASTASSLLVGPPPPILQRPLSSASMSLNHHHLASLPRLHHRAFTPPIHHNQNPLVRKLSPPLTTATATSSASSSTAYIASIPSSTRDSLAEITESQQQSKLVHHRNLSLETPKRFPCTEPGCEKSFTRRYNLSAHLRCHRSEKPFACGECDFRFARKHDLTRHVRSLHELKRSYGPCPTCGAYFTRSDALSRHLKVEAERKMYDEVHHELHQHQ